MIGDQALLELNIRTYNEQTRSSVLAAIRRMATAECGASAAPAAPEFELFDQFPLTTNDEATTTKVAAAFAAYFGDRAAELPLQSASEDFSDIPNALGAPYSYWGSAESIPRRTDAPGQRDGSLRTSRSTTRPSSRPSSSPPSTPACKPSSSPPWHTSKRRARLVATRRLAI